MRTRGKAVAVLVVGGDCDCVVLFAPCKLAAPESPGGGIFHPARDAVVAGRSNVALVDHFLQFCNGFSFRDAPNQVLPMVD